MSLDRESAVPLQVGELNEADPFQGLTSKQWRFVQASFAGLSDADAYRKAYNVSGSSDATILTDAARIAKHPRIMAKLAAMRRETDAQATLAPLLSREFVVAGITEIATDKQIKPNVRLAAYVHLGKVAGIDLFRETTRVERVERTPEDIDQELRQRLGELAKTIEGSASSVPADKPPARRRRRST